MGSELCPESIGVAALAELGRLGPVDLIDVRTAAEFGALRAECARNVPLAQLEPRDVAAAREGTTPIYLICASGKRSAAAAARFAQAGVTGVANVEGGMRAWVSAGLPVLRDPRAMALARQVRIGAGLAMLLGVALAVWVHPYAVALSAAAGAGLLSAKVRGVGCRVLSRMPWNRA